MVILKILMACIGGLVTAFGFLCLGISMLGLLGVLADVGPGENFRMGQSVLVFSIPFFASGVMLLIGALHLHLRQSSNRGQHPTASKSEPTN